MKYFFSSIICLLTWCTLAEAQQISANDLSAKDHFITCTVGVNSSVHYEARYENFFEDKWSLLYTFGFSHSEIRRYSELRLPMGPSVATGLVIAAAACSVSDGLLLTDGELLKLACFIPDGISYHHKFRGGYYFSPFINWSGISIRVDNETDEVNWIYTPKLGLRLIKPLGKFGVISAEQTIQRGQDNQIQFYPSVGVSVRF